jgi:hypothetical protein
MALDNTFDFICHLQTMTLFIMTDFIHFGSTANAVQRKRRERCNMQQSFVILNVGPSTISCEERWPMDRSYHPGRPLQKWKAGGVRIEADVVQRIPRHVDTLNYTFVH